MRVLAPLLWAGVGVTAHVGQVVLPTGFGGGRALFPCTSWAGNVDGDFSVFHGAVTMGSFESTGTIIHWWQDLSVCVMLLLSSPLACFCHDFWSSNVSLQLAKGV